MPAPKFTTQPSSKSMASLSHMDCRPRGFLFFSGAIMVILRAEAGSPHPRFPREAPES